MASFPTLSRYPEIGSFKETKAYDPSLRSQMGDGTVVSRAKFTANKKKWQLTYRLLTDADKTLLDTFQDTVMIGSDTFSWTSPQQNDGSTYTVRFEGPIQFRLMSESHLEWEAKMNLIEA